MATVQVAAPAPKVDNAEKKKNGVSTTTAPNITLSAPQRLALAKPTIAAALGPNPGREALRTRFNARNNKEQGTLDLVVTAQIGRAHV